MFTYFRTLAISALLVLHSVASIATPVDTRAEEELVKVPGGFLPKSNVHIVPEGAKIVHTPELVQLFDADGKLLHSAALTGSSPLFNNVRSPSKTSLGARQNGNSGTVVAGAAAPSVTAFLGRWDVPPLPQKNSNQTLQYFLGIGTGDLTSLVFPVLQYGVAANGGGPNWSLASWLITGDQAFATNATATLGAVFPNNPLNAQVSNLDNILFPPAGTDVWQAIFGSFPQTALQVQSTVPLTEVVVVLETENAFLDNNLPNEPTDLSFLGLLNKDGSASATIPWTVSPPVDFDFITLEVFSNSGVDGELIFFYNEVPP